MRPGAARPREQYPSAKRMVVQRTFELIGPTRCLAVEWAQQGIIVLNVAAGYIETNLNKEFLRRKSVRDYLLPRIPLGRPGKPEEVARLVAALFSEELPFMTGETIYIDGGQSIAH